MNYSERKNILYRIILTLLILCSMGLMVFSFIHVVTTESEDKIISIAACIAAIAFALFEIVMGLKGGKKDLGLYNIAFNKNGVINNVPLFAVIISTVFGAGLSALGIALLLTQKEEPSVTAALIVLSISAYLVVNCLAYFIYVLMFRNKPMKLEDLIK